MNVSILARLVSVGITIAAAAAASGASAQPRPIAKLDLSAPIADIDERSVDAALGVVTGNQVQGVEADGSPKLLATATNGLQFEVRFRSCEPVDASTDAATGSRHCKALYIISAWDPVPADRHDEMLEAVSLFEQEHPAANAGLFDDGSPYVVRYVITDHGAIQGNLVSEFANFIRSASDFQNRIYPIYFQTSGANPNR